MKSTEQRWRLWGPVPGALELVFLGGCVGFSELDEGREILRVEEQQTQHVGLSRLARSETPKQMTEHAGLELIGESSEVARWTRYEQLDRTEPHPLLGWHLLEQLVDPLELQRVPAQVVQEDRVEELTRDLEGRAGIRRPPRYPPPLETTRVGSSPRGYGWRPNEWRASTEPLA